jgi:hypothetical protein
LWVRFSIESISTFPGIDLLQLCIISVKIRRTIRTERFFITDI